MANETAATAPVLARPQSRKHLGNLVQKRWGWVSALLILAMLGGIGLWKGFLRDRLVVKKWGVVVPGTVYRSGQISQHLIRKTLQEHGIKHIICLVTLSDDDPDQLEERRVAQELGIEFTSLPMAGNGTGKVETWVQAVEAITRDAKAHRPVLVHCHAGAQRTGGVVAAYRLLVEHKTADEAINELKTYGWKPHLDQILLDFVNTNLPVAANNLKTKRLLAEVPDHLPVLR